VVKKGKSLPAVSGSAAMISEGVRALERLQGLLDSLGDAEVAEIEIWENMPITAKISLDLMMEDYGWNGERWVPIGY
jgi:hypothetical protein